MLGGPLPPSLFSIGKGFIFLFSEIKFCAKFTLQSNRNLKTVRKSLVYVH